VNTYWVDGTDGVGRRVRRRIGQNAGMAILVDAEIAISRLKGIEHTGSHARPAKRHSESTLAGLLSKYAVSPTCQSNADARKRLGFLGRTVERLGGSVGPETLTPAVIHRYQECRLAAGVTGSTINRETGYLHVALAWAERSGLIEGNPISGYRHLPENPARERVLTDAEYRAIRLHLAPHALPIFELRYRLPFRGQDAMALHVEHIHLEDPRGHIEIPGAHTKSGRARVVPLWWPHLRGVLAAIVSGRTEGPLWLYDGRPLKSWRTTFLRACGEAGVAGFQERDLRHCAITSLVLRGVPLHELAYASDHASLLIQRRYTNLTAHTILQCPSERYDPATRVIELVECNESPPALERGPARWFRELKQKREPA